MNIDPNFGLPNENDVFKEIAKGEQHIVISLDTRRYGKKITLVKGFDKSVDIRQVAKNLKEGLACGGTIKDGTIELQGDHLKKVKPHLMKMGFPEEAIND